jgi:hypothetical protein
VGRSRWEWVLVELERPRHRLFTKAGDPSSELTHALRQIADWRSWLQNNLHFARTLLTDIVPLCDVAVVLGRRENVDDQDRDRLEMLQLQTPGLRVATFDALLDVCRVTDGAGK